MLGNRDLKSRGNSFKKSEMGRERRACYWLWNEEKWDDKNVFALVPWMDGKWSFRWVEIWQSSTSLSSPWFIGGLNQIVTITFLSLSLYEVMIEIHSLSVFCNKLENYSFQRKVREREWFWSSFWFFPPSLAQYFLWERIAETFSIPILCPSSTSLSYPIPFKSMIK